MNTLYCGKRSVPIHSYTSHSHKCYEMILQTKGHCQTIINSKEYYIDKNTVMIIPPNIPHEANSDVLFKDFFIQAKSLKFNDVYIIRLPDNTILTLINLLHSTLLEKETNYKVIADNLLDTVCSYLTKYMQTEYKYSFVNSLKNTILENFSNCDFNLSEEITKTNYNKDYIRRCFEQEIGKTPLEYLTLLRINQAKMLLVQSTFKSVSDVAEKCGFSDPLYFSTLFKKHTGLSPSKYRLKNN